MLHLPLLLRSTEFFARKASPQQNSTAVMDLLDVFRAADVETPSLNEAEAPEAQPSEPAEAEAEEATPAAKVAAVEPPEPPPQPAEEEPEEASNMEGRAIEA